MIHTGKQGLLIVRRAGLPGIVTSRTRLNEPYLCLLLLLSWSLYWRLWSFLRSRLGNLPHSTGCTGRSLGDIGQTYGAASALLTGLALIGVVGSMVFQVRAIRVSQEQVTREQHAHLVEMALMDPVYQRAWG